MAKKRTPTFITEVPLLVDDRQSRLLLIRMDCARQVYNACLGESFKRLGLMRESKGYQAAVKLEKGKQRAAAFGTAKERYGLRNNDLHSYAKQFNHCWIGEHLDINTIQKLASRAFQAVNMYAVGKRGKPRFKGKHQLVSVEGKTNKSGIRWREDSRVEWLGMQINAVIDERDEVIRSGLESRIKYVRLLTRRIRGKTKFFVQLICEGLPYRKEKNSLGSGRVGLDVGPSTIAVVSEQEALLRLFCHELEGSEREIRRIQRKMDRQKRANNPQNFNTNGTVKNGAKHWIKSKKYRKSQDKLADVRRQQAAYRKSLHGRLANDILRMGDVISFEKISYRAFQKMFGKSVGKRAPGMFISLLKRKAESAGGSTNEYDIRTTRHSQLCHHCGTLEKKPLSQRWHECDCGVVAQRDLYSAFLAMCMDGKTFNADYAKEAWSGAETRLRVALKETQLVNGGQMPASFGLNRRQNQSPVILDEEVCEAQVAVPDQNIDWREPARAISTPRTPRL